MGEKRKSDRNVVAALESARGPGAPFKKCKICNTEWHSRESFLSDPNLELIGYQVHFDELKAGLFYFNHSCNGSLALYADQFMDLYTGPVFSDRATGGDDCPEYCLYKHNLDRCPADCECASVREVIQVIKGWRKDQAV